MKHSTAEAAVRCSADAVGYKQLGTAFWPHLSHRPDDAVRRLSNTLDPSRRDRLTITQVQTILREAGQRGSHEGMQAFAAGAGYRVLPIEHDMPTAVREVSDALERFEVVRAWLMDARSVHAHASEAVH